MTIPTYFAQDYSEARDKFCSAAREAGAELVRYDNPAGGPNGVKLSTDVAWLGPKDASNVLVTISGTHGAEGFCGSGVQVGWFATGLAAEMPADTALLQIHGSNPYGFAWLRRTTEENVDLNRNYVDFDKPLPVNADYEKYRDIICPAEWNDEVDHQTTTEIMRLMKELPPMVMQGAITSGQYVDPNGLFYGGNRISWSRRTTGEIFERFLGNARKVTLVDYHTGLGPRGYGERICDGGKGHPAYERARAWWGDVTSPEGGTSTSAPLHGLNMPGMIALLPHAEVTATALEYGTQPLTQVLRALRADNWLHAHGDMDSEQGRQIKAQARDAFYQDADDWKMLVFSRGVDTQTIALRAMAG